jgi:hypothetical protein
MQTTLPDRKIYGIICILGALLNLGLLIVVLSPITPQSLTLTQLGYAWGIFAVPLLITISLLIMGIQALKVTRPTTVQILRLSTIIGLITGSILGFFLGQGIAKPGPDAVGMGYVVILPLPVWITMTISPSFNTASFFITLIHTIFIIALGLNAFWLARRSGSVKYSIGNTLFLVFIVTLFTLVAGIIYGWVRGHELGRDSGFDFYAGYGLLFEYILVHLLAYILIIGVPAAFLGRAQHRHIQPAIV